LSTLGLVAFLYHVASRIAYVTGVGRALRREPRTDADYPGFYRRASLLMNNDAVSFVALALITQGTIRGVPRLPLVLIGATLIVVGLAVKLWAREAVGHANYYWRDFFGTPPAPRELGGPYRFLSSPMYTVGNLHLWGIALAAASLPGLIAAAFSHAAILVFNRVVEQPQVRVMYGSHNQSRGA
jgi:hypothetical protein